MPTRAYDMASVRYINRRCEVLSLKFREGTGKGAQVGHVHDVVHARGTQVT